MWKRIQNICRLLFLLFNWIVYSIYSDYDTVNICIALVAESIHVEISIIKSMNQLWNYGNFYYESESDFNTFQTF